jgi:succinate dehydrogenase/fumarate reductase flavoprotein subunit
MAEHVGPMRSEQGLKTGLDKLQSIEQYLDEMKANDLHELMRSHETRSILSVGKVMAHTALFRTESRNKPYHHRLDFPDTDNSKWCGLVVVQKKGNEFSCSFEAIS